MQDHTQALREALQGFLDFHTKPAGISVELITEKDLFTQALADIGKREDALIAAARAALSSNQSAPVALGGEKGEAVAWMKRDAARYRWLRAGNYPISFARSVLNDTPHGIDAAIDAAIAFQPPRGV